MRATELRLGNLFIDEKTKTILKVTGLTKGIISFSGQFYCEWQAKPIPLTEDWLLKFGSEKIRNYFNIGYEYDIFKYDAGYYIHINSNSIYLKHVHQLQNLYFALTGQELTIKQ